MYDIHLLGRLSTHYTDRFKIPLRGPCIWNANNFARLVNSFPLAQVARQDLSALCPISLVLQSHLAASFSACRWTVTWFGTRNGELFRSKLWTGRGSRMMARTCMIPWTRKGETGACAELPLCRARQIERDIIFTNLMELPLVLDRPCEKGCTLAS